MVEFLTTTGVSYRLEEIIKNASERLVIISPFLRVNERVKELLADKNRMKIDIRVIYGKNELRPEENNWLESMDFIRTSFCNNLHAKCYLNENEALLTSMNLYEFSQINNNEMGLLVSRKEEPDLYEKIREESMRLVRVSEEIRVKVARVDPTEGGKESAGTVETPREPRQPSRPQPPREQRSASAIPKNGFCIRCKTDLPIASPVRPYCSRCYTSWNRYKRDDYEEKHCHTCGIEHATSMSKPFCLACFRKYKDVLVLATS